MAYTINLTDGSIFATIADGTINTSSSMILVGKNYAGYGEFLDENFIRLLENGANTTAPGAPLIGQLWWDKSTNTMKVYTGATFKTISSATASGTAPTNNVVGDLWWDTTNGQLNAWNGASFTLIGPSSTSTQGTSGAIVATINDTGGTPHVVIQLWTQNVIVGMISKDSAFVPQTAVAGSWGITQIKPGFTLNPSVTNNLYNGTAEKAQQLTDGVSNYSPSDFLSSVANDTTSGTLGILNDTGLTVGADQDAKISVNVSTSAVTLQNQTADANLEIAVNDGGTPTTVMLVNGATSVVSFPAAAGVSVTGNITVAGNITATGGTVSFGTGNVAIGNLINNNSNGVGNLGSSTRYFNTVFALATSAQYADVAERFAADDTYLAGTVVEIGGPAEVTMSVQELSENVFGVISSRAAYLMNSGAGTDETHPPIAMTGRVPVRVTGSVKKGDRLVSAGNGLARSAQPGEANSFNVIGRALADKNDISEGLVEAIVTIKN